MYKDYFQLKGEPFNLTPDPRYLYLTSQHREALDHLLYGITQRKGFVRLTGEVGTGKTTLCRALLAELGPRYHTALILNPTLSPSQLLRAIVEEFGLDARGGDRLTYLRRLNEFLLEINSRGRDAVLIIDEAQDMSIAALEMVRLLSNLETECHKLLQIVLVGQEELRDILAAPALRQLAQRIMVCYHLGRMDAHETEQYLHHRLRVAGAASESPVQFDRSAVREVYRYSRGTPRLINAIGDKALLAGFVHQTNHIDRRLVRLAVGELKEAG
ncbi:MAG: AAA family ATPase [Phycisphaerae bacterium]|nr:AAA family ATPase [Phycisphaerae bacterium]